MKRRFLVFAGTLMLMNSAAWSQAKLVEKITKQGSDLVIPYEKYVLPNGLTLIVHEDHSDPIVHIDVTYHVGSAREEIGKSGFAHFFEHMMFQGSDHIADGQHIKMVEESGGTMNGSTNLDRTNYFETIPVNQMEKLLWAESDRMGFLINAVTQKKFEIQRSTVKNERGQRYDNAPYGLANETISKVLYPYGHPYSWLTIGYVEDLNRVNAADLKNFFLRWYGPNNATLSVGGDVKPAEVVKLVEKYFGPIPRGPEVTPTVLPAPVVKENRYVTMVDNYARLPRLYVVYPSVPQFTKDIPALECLGEVLGQGKNSVLYQMLVKKQLALQASAFSNDAELAGDFRFVMTPMPGKTLSDLEKMFRASLDSFEARGVTDDDVAKFKGGNEAQIVSALESVSGKTSTLAAYQTFTNNPNFIEEERKRYAALTKEDVMRVYNQYVKGKAAVILSAVPKGQEGLIAAADNFKIDSSNYKAPDYGYAGLNYVMAKDNFDRSKVPAAGAAPVVKVPTVWKKTLSNGVKAIGTESNELPEVTISLIIPGGHIMQANNLSKAGLASFFAAMMNEDTKNYSAEKMSVTLQKLGANLSVGSSVNGIVFSVKTLKKNTDAVLALLQERLLNPSFTESAFNRIKKQRLESFKLSKAQPSAVADDVFARLNYGNNNILGINQNGTEETVKNITLQDIQDYYNNYMTSRDAKLVIVGDVTEAEILPKLAFLNKLPNKKIELPKIDAAPKVDKTQVYMVDVPKGAQTEFRIGYATGMKWDATGDYYKSQLANLPLSGVFNSRLNLKLREEKGWTYGSQSSFQGDEIGGVFRFASGIRADATDSAMAEIMKDVNKYYSEGMTEAELKFTTNTMAQLEALRYETPAQKAGFVRRILDYNLPDNYTQMQAKLLKSISKTEIDKIIKEKIQPSKLNVLLVGDKAKILEKIKKLGYDVIELDADGKKVGDKKEM